MADSSRSYTTTLLTGLSRLPLGVVRWLGRQFGGVAARLDRRTQEAIEVNLSICLPNLTQQQRNAMRRKRMGLIGQTAAEMSHFWTKDSATLLSRCVDGPGAAEFKQALLAEEHGVLAIAPHMGNWESLNNYICSVRPMTVMYRPQKNEALDAFILKARERSGAELAPTNRRGVMQLMKTLNAGGVVGILPDQVPQKGSGEYAPFFGRPAYTMTLASQLANKTKAKAFIVAGIQTPTGFEMVAYPVDEDFYSDDIKTSLTALNRGIEQLVLTHPEQYQWEYKRFKTPPEGLKNPYNEYRGKE